MTNNSSSNNSLSCSSTTVTVAAVTGNKYVPPHLRNSQGGGGSSNSGKDDNNNTSNGGHSNGFSRFSGGDRRSSYSDRRSGSYNENRYNNDRRSFNDRRGSYNDRRGGGDNDNYRSGGGGGGGEGDMPPTNSRWSNVNMGGGYGGGGRQSSYRGGGGGYGGGRRDSGMGAPTNERGFHGDMRPDPRLEQRLFGRSDKQTTGINFDNYDKIPIEVSGEGIPDPCEMYSEESIGVDLFRNTQLCGYNKPTPVQKYSVPIGSAGRDLMACAQTGSGKTAGFLFPIIMAMIRTGGSDPPDNSHRRVYPNALVLAPTRELAQQIHEEACRFTYCTGIAPVVIYGGADARDQLRQIERGCDLLVATPGRLVDFIDRGRLAMESVRFLVLDEADRMLDMGFEVCFFLNLRIIICLPRVFISHIFPCYFLYSLKFVELSRRVTCLLAMIVRP